jgi:hypothetical protein
MQMEKPLSEEICISARGDTYEDGILNAMISVQKFLDTDSHVYRNEDDCSHQKDWFITTVYASPSPGETKIMMHVTFQLAGSDSA